MSKPLVDWKKVENENYIKDYFSDKEIEFKNLNQGVFEDDFYFGKLITKENKKGKSIEVPALIFSNRKVVVDESFFDGKNGIKEMGINYKTNLQFSKQSWTNDDIRKFINYENETPTTKELFEKIRTQIEKYMDVYDSAIYDVCALYVMHTYLFSLFNSTGYLFLCSRRESGKTKLMNILGYMCFNTENATNPSESALFRMCDIFMPTLLIDDFEKIDDDKQKYILQILKTGYKKGGCVVRTEKVKDNFKIQKFDTFCPKIITNTTGIDEITATRCITIKLIKTKTTKGNLEPNENESVWREIRSLCYFWALENWSKILEIYSNYENNMFKNREMELLKGILSICKDCGADIENRVSNYMRVCIDDRDITEEDWEQILLYEIIRKGELESNNLLGKDWYDLKEILSVCDGVVSLSEGDESRSDKTLQFRSENKARIYVGRVLSKLPLDIIKKKRTNKGTVYFFNIAKLKDYYGRTYGDELNNE